MPTKLCIMHTIIFLAPKVYIESINLIKNGPLGGGGYNNIISYIITVLSSWLHYNRGSYNSIDRSRKNKNT